MELSGPVVVQHHDLDHGFSRSNFENAVSQEWEGRLTWNGRDVSRLDVRPTTRFKMLYVLTSSKYTWSRKQIPEVEWDTQEEIQLLELLHRLTHIFGQIPSLSIGLSYDQQCYQWFSGKLNCFMDTYLSSSAGQDTEATHSVAKWSLSNRFMSNPDCIFCHPDGCKKSKKNILLDNRVPIQIWIWWWRNCNQNCRSLKQDHDFLLWIKG